ncbi:hypothetical protein [Bilophila sp.]
MALSEYLAVLFPQDAEKMALFKFTVNEEKYAPLTAGGVSVSEL